MSHCWENPCEHGISVKEKVCSLGLFFRSACTLESGMHTALKTFKFMNSWIYGICRIIWIQLEKLKYAIFQFLIKCSFSWFHKHKDSPRMCTINTLRLRQTGHYFPHNIFKYIFFNENAWISIKISLKFVPQGPNENKSTLGSGNGLAPNRWQAIIWAKVVPG